MTLKPAAASFLALFLVAACAQAQRESGGYGSSHTHRFQQPAERAARCVASNAEAHSGALVSEVRVDRDAGAHVIVRVKNGVTYATADIRRAGTASSGTITLNVRSSGRGADLLSVLVKGC